TNRWAAGFNREKAIFIISGESEKIGDAIMESLHRGVTYLEGRGGFLQEKKDVAFVVVSLTQLARVKAICDRFDANAFLIIANASEVRGRGFSSERILYQFAKRREMIEARERRMASIKKRQETFDEIKKDDGG
ncbi:YitT family protein, partial [Selenomonas sp.]|uniref:YitT family protein n=1 Tax=Selenomonas sp. TaxID=2053611 RepID=UPI003FA319B8